MSGRRWQLQEAKNKLSEVIERARKEGPQTITRHDADAAVVLSMEDYRRLARPSSSLLEFLRDSPLHGVEIDLERDRDTGRSVPL